MSVKPVAETGVARSATKLVTASSIRIGTPGREGPRTDGEARGRERASNRRASWAARISARGRRGGRRTVGEEAAGAALLEAVVRVLHVEAVVVALEEMGGLARVAVAMEGRGNAGDESLMEEMRAALWEGFDFEGMGSGAGAGATASKLWRGGVEGGGVVGGATAGAGRSAGAGSSVGRGPRESLRRKTGIAMGILEISESRDTIA